MGDDGATGMLALKRNGAETIAQDEATSAIYGMPRAAVETGCVDRSIALDHLADALVQIG